MCLPAWYDVDDRDSLKLLRAELFDGWSRLRRTSATATTARHSPRLLGRLLADNRPLAPP